MSRKDRSRGHGLNRVGVSKKKKSESSDSDFFFALIPHSPTHDVSQMISFEIFHRRSRGEGSGKNKSKTSEKALYIAVYYWGSGRCIFKYTSNQISVFKVFKIYPRPIKSRIDAMGIS